MGLYNDDKLVRTVLIIAVYSIQRGVEVIA